MIKRRLHGQALKVAIFLAALDWADDNRHGQPDVRAAHWFRAQQITETWRASAHRLLHELGETEESRLDVWAIQLLRAHPEGLVCRQINKVLKTARKPVLELLHAPVQDVQIRKLLCPPMCAPAQNPKCTGW